MGVGDAGDGVGDQRGSGLVGAIHGAGGERAGGVGKNGLVFVPVEAERVELPPA